MTASTFILHRYEDKSGVSAWPACDVAGCDARSRARRGGLCGKHYMRWLRHGSTDPRPRRSKELVPNWVGEEITYKPAHSRVVRARGKAAEHPCVNCGKPARDWAYNHLDPSPLTAPDGRLYSSKPEYYDPMCKTCHRRLDVAKRTEAGGWKTHCKNGHEFTPENTALLKKGGRGCRACDREQKAKARQRYAQRTHCRRGHAMAAGNVLHGKDGRRICRTCHWAAIAKRGSKS